MGEDLRKGIRQEVDPDPLVIDILAGLASTAIASAIAKVAKRIYARRGRSEKARDVESSDVSSQATILRRNLNVLEDQIRQALTLIPPGQKRELGQEILMDQRSVEQYHELREGLFSQVRDVDRVTEDMVPLGSTLAPAGGRTNLPRDFRAQLKLVERKLRGARTARLSDEALLELRSAATAMGRMIDYLEEADRP